MKQSKKNTNNSCSLVIQNVSKKYDEIFAVNDISFETKQGEVIALLGPNGAGKSTLMNMIAGFLSPTSGHIWVNSKDVEKDALDTKKVIGFLPEGAPMYADMSVSLFLKYMIELKLNLTETEQCSKSQIKDCYKEEFMRIVDLAKVNDVLHQRIDTLSKGYLRRVGFAQSIIGNPPILLLDEPTDGLDPNQKEHMRHLICDMKKDKTILISTHLLDEAETVASRIILINKGKIVADGDLKSILKCTHKNSLAEAFHLLTTTEGNIHE